MKQLGPSFSLKYAMVRILQESKTSDRPYRLRKSEFLGFSHFLGLHRFLGQQNSLGTLFAQSTQGVTWAMEP